MREKLRMYRDETMKKKPTVKNVTGYWEIIKPLLQKWRRILLGTWNVGVLH